MIIASNLTVLGSIVAHDSVSTASNLWEDLRFTPQELDPVGTPSAAVLSSTWGPNSNKMSISFAPSGTQCMFITAQLAHDYVSNTVIYPHIHVSPNTTTNGDVVFITRYSWASIGQAFPSETVVTNVVTFTAGDKWNNRMVNLPPGGITPGVGAGQISSILSIRFERDGSNSLDTYANTIDVLEYDIHYRTQGEPVQYTP